MPLAEGAGGAVAPCRRPRRAAASQLQAAQSNATLAGDVWHVHLGGCGRLQFELPADTSPEDVAYIESLVPQIETELLKLRDPGTGEVVLSCRPSLLKTATRSAVKLRH